jgi:transposase
MSDRAALTGMLYVLHTGIPWECLPREMGRGSSMTCWRRLRDWQHAGVWQHLHEAAVHKLRQYDQIGLLPVSKTPC